MLAAFATGIALGVVLGFLGTMFLIFALPVAGSEKPQGHRCVRCHHSVAKNPNALCTSCAKAVEASRPKAPLRRLSPPPRRLPDQHIYVHHAK